MLYLSVHNDPLYIPGLYTILGVQFTPFDFQLILVGIRVVSLHVLDLHTTLCNGLFYAL